MGNIVMTLLVRRQPMGKTESPYAVQVTFPREMSPGEMTSLTSARLIHPRGISPLATETIDTYRPEEWRAANLAEQAQFAVQFNGNPRPWHCVSHSLCRSVYDYPGSGDKDTNNGQVWTGIDALEKDWKTERKMRQKCDEELEEEWKMRFAGEEETMARVEAPFQWAWRQIGPR